MNITKLLLLLIVFIVSSSAYAQQASILWQKAFGTEGSDYVSDIIEHNSGYVLLTSKLDTSWVSCHGEGNSDGWIVGVDSMFNIQWYRCYGGSQSDALFLIRKNSMGGYYVLGRTQSEDGDLHTPIVGISDIWLMRLDNNFDIVWSRSLTCYEQEDIKALVPAADGGIIVMANLAYAGYDVTTVYGDNDVWLCKVDLNGVIEWDQTYGNNYLDMGITLIGMENDSYYITAQSEWKGGMVECHRSDGQDFSDIIIYEIDAYGNLLWQHCYGGNRDEFEPLIFQQNDGFLLVSGTPSNDLDVSGLHMNSTREAPDIWLVKCDLNGDIVWQKCLGGSQDEWPFFIDQTANGDIVIVGTSSSNDGDVSNYHGDPSWDQYDIWAVVTDSVGNIKWNTCYGGQRKEELLKVFKKSDYKYIVFALAFENNGDIACLPYPSDDPTHDVWFFEFNVCYELPPTPPAPLGPDKVCTEESPSTVYTLPPSGNYSYEWILEPQEAGAMEPADNEVIVNWTEDFTGTSAIVARAVDIVCGNSEWSQACFTIVHNCTGINLSENKNIRVWPNPGNEKVVFEIVENVSVKSPGVVEIYNRMGQSVAYFEIADDKANWFCEHVPDGIYIYRFMIDNKVVVGKIAIKH